MALSQAEFLKLTQKLQAKPISAPSQGFSVADTVSDIRQTGSSVLGTAKSTFSKQKEALGASIAGEQSIGAGIGQAFGIGAGGVSRAVGDVVTGAVKTALPQSAETSLKAGIANTVAPVMETDFVKNIMAGYEALDEKSKRDIDAKLGVASLASEFLGLGTAKRAGTAAKNTVESAIERAARPPAVVDEIVTGTGSNAKQKLIEFIAPDVDEQTKTILKRAKPEEIDSLVEIQKKAIADPEAVTPYEVIGDKMSEATRQLQSKLKQIGAKKSELVAPAGNGLDAFNTKPFIEKLNSLKNNVASGDKALVSSILEKANAVKTKFGADKFIDEVQDVLFKGSRDNTIPKGSSVEKQLKGIIGELNSDLKKVLPPKYAQLNAEYSNIKKVVDALNSALGEVVEGVSTRGGSLVKQFFSPNGRKAKELFAYINKKTGIDLAKDATLSRYVMELYNDPRANTLLGGNIPTNVQGVIGKTADFLVEKTGIGKGLQNAAREGAISKAKRAAGKTAPRASEGSLIEKAPAKGIPNKQGGFIRIPGVKATNIHPDDAKIMKKFINDARIKSKSLGDSEFAQAEKLAERFGISMDKGLANVAKAFDDILSGRKKVKGTLVPGSLKKAI